MTPAVCIPWRAGDPYREEAYARVLPAWEAMGYRVYTGDSGDPKFNRAASRNVAARAAVTADVLILADADCLVEPEAVEQAVNAAVTAQRVIFCHNRYQRLDRRGKVAASSLGNPTNAGVLAIARTAFERVGGYDESLSGWGFEDAAFWYATETILGPCLRANGYMTELYHPKAHDIRAEDKALFREYRAALGDPDAMLALIASRP